MSANNVFKRWIKKLGSNTLSEIRASINDEIMDRKKPQGQCDPHKPELMIDNVGIVERVSYDDILLSKKRFATRGIRFSPWRIDSGGDIVDSRGYCVADNHSMRELVSLSRQSWKIIQ